jgi:hypothetical protein
MRTNRKKKSAIIFIAAIAVCTDLVAAAMKGEGYDLREDLSDLVGHYRIYNT